MIETDELSRTPTAPPRDPIETLIEEVRHRARRRRWRNFALVFTALVVGSASYLEISEGVGSPPPITSFTFAASVPPSVALAISNLLAVRSIEIVANNQPGPSIYQAPDLYAAPMSGTRPGPNWYVYRDAQFWAVPLGLFGRATVRQFPGISLAKHNGISPAQQTAFQTLLDYLPFATHFVENAAGLFRFRLTVPRSNDSLTLYTRGSIWVSDGYIAAVELTNSRSPSAEGTPSTLITRYERIDDNPHLGAPQPDVSMCLLPVGSLVLRRCKGEAFVMSGVQ